MFAIRLQLTVSESHQTLEARDFDPEYDDIESLLADACEILHGAGAEFLVEGFGERWPVDVWMDLLVVLKQTPRVLDSLRRGEPAKLDFYEQGIERRLDISVEGTTARLTCISGTSWVPSPSEEVMSVDNLIETLERLRTDFRRFTSYVCPSLATHPWMNEWCARGSGIV